jgi:hypothetical protein
MEAFSIIFALIYFLENLSLICALYKNISKIFRGRVMNIIATGKDLKNYPCSPERKDILSSRERQLI